MRLYVRFASNSSEMTMEGRRLLRRFRLAGLPFRSRADRREVLARDGLVFEKELGAFLQILMMAFQDLDRVLEGGLDPLADGEIDLSESSARQTS